MTVSSFVKCIKLDIASENGFVKTKLTPTFTLMTV